MKKIGVVIADELEYKPFIKTIEQEAEVEHAFCMGYETARFSIEGIESFVIRSNIGKVNAATAATLLVNDGCTLLLNAGLSGAVKNVFRGDLVVGTSFVEADFDLTPLGFAQGEKPGQEHVYKTRSGLVNLMVNATGARPTVLGSGDFFLTEQGIKEMYHTIFGIEAFDMESAAIASVCHRAGIPFASLRKISDGDDKERDAAQEYQAMNALEDTALYELLITCTKTLAVTLYDNGFIE